jgi:hypothetical protein
MASISAVSISAAARVSADLFSSASASQSPGGGDPGIAKLDRADLEWCGTVPKKFPFPPPPPPWEHFERFAQVELGSPKSVIDDWCGTVPKRFPLPPTPPPGPWAEGLSQILATR